MSGRLRWMVVAAAILMSLAVLSAAGGSGAVAPKRGGTVFMPGGPEPACLTPYIVACTSGLMVTFMDSLPRAVLPGAYELRPDLTWKAQLVSKTDVSAKQALTLTYHIRPEARWSDGVPVSSRDFLFTYRTLRTYKTQLDQVDRVVVDLIRSVRALDAKTVRVVLPLDLTMWRGWVFRTVLPRHVLEGEDYLTVWRKRIENPTTGEPVGSGPFLVSGWERGKQLTLVRNPRYWGSHAAYAKRVALRFGLEGTPAAWLASCAVDVAWGLGYETGLGPEAIPSLKAARDVRVLSRLAPALDVITINVGTGGNSLLGEKFVRKALAYGVDRQAIVRKLFGATLPKQQVTDNSDYLNSSPYYRANWGRYRYRPAEARRLLERGGCVRGTDRIFICGGERLSLRFVTRGDIPSRVTTLELVRDQLKAAGIEVVPVYASGDVAFNRIWLVTRGWDLLEVAAIYWIPMDEYALSPFACEDIRSGFGWTRYCQRLDRAILSRAAYTLGARERARVVNQIDAALAEDVPALPLFWKPAIAAAVASLRGYVIHPLDPFWRAEEWWLDRDR
jgi:peptide/nickel transport system substrate-binding protein